MNKEIVKFLQNIGVDTRFVSIIENKIFINNLKFSRFSRKKEELFKKSFPEIEVIRSKIFQKICTRASRNLAHCIRPKEKIFLLKDDDPRNFSLYVILEPYKRKYGIEIVFGTDINETRDLDVNSVAIPLILDDEAINILNLILNGKKVELLSSNQLFSDKKLIYPLLNVPKSWIYSWIRNDKDNEDRTDYKYARDLLKFLETIIPDVRENLFKSALFLQNET